MRRVVWILIGAGVAGLALGLLVCIALWPFALNPANAAALSAVATAAGALVGFLAALASLAAAWAAMAAAQKSDETAARATEALGLAIAPAVCVRVDNETADLDGVATRLVTVWNAGQGPAVNVDLELRRRDGRRERRHIRRLDATEVNENGFPRDDSEMFEFPMEPPADVADGAWRGKVAWEEVFTVEYSDERGLIRWRGTYPFTYSASSTDEVRGYGIEPGPGGTERVK